MAVRYLWRCDKDRPMKNASAAATPSYSAAWDMAHARYWDEDQARSEELTRLCAENKGRQDREERRARNRDWMRRYRSRSKGGP